MEKSLIVITTSYRSDALKAFVWDYINFIKKNINYDFLVALDGQDCKTINYCKKYNIPLLYSMEREGVGISKNRVLESFPNYDYYFFIEDDVELLNPKVFDIHIELSKITKIHHFSLFDKSRIIKKIAETNVGKYTIIHSLYGSAQFNFFTNEGIKKVGGFHPMFAKYRRFGHTEHTYRFINVGLAKYPFNIIKECLEGYFNWHEPKSVTKLKVNTSKNRLFIEEEKLIEQKLKFYPLKTLSKYKIINFNKEITEDKYKSLNKKIFILKMKILNLLRNIKRMLLVMRNEK